MRNNFDHNLNEKAHKTAEKGKLSQQNCCGFLMTAITFEPEFVVRFLGNLYHYLLTFGDVIIST